MNRGEPARTLRRVASAQIPTRWGVFQTIGFERETSNGNETALAIVLGDPGVDGAPLVRLHSQCFTGEVLGSLRCDCGDQLYLAMRAIAEEGTGLVIYEHQEGRGIGLMAKLQAYSLQDNGLDTVEANHALGFAADCRDFGLPAAILRERGVTSVRLLSNNPDKSRALLDAGIEVVTRIPCEAEPNNHSFAYLRAKKEKLGHALTLQDDGFEFATIDEAVRELREGRMMVVIDDEDRENEGDLTMAAEMVTPETINFMATHGRGLICLAMTGERLDQLELAPMAPHNTALGGTAFTVSIDARGGSVTTGISAHDRAHTIRTAA